MSKVREKTWKRRSAGRIIYLYQTVRFQKLLGYEKCLLCKHFLSQQYLKWYTYNRLTQGTLKVKMFSFHLVDNVEQRSMKTRMQVLYSLILIYNLHVEGTKTRVLRSKNDNQFTARNPQFFITNIHSIYFHIRLKHCTTF